MTFPTLPTREGDRPHTGPEVPHLQLSQTGPAEARGELLEVDGRRAARHRLGPEQGFRSPAPARCSSTARQPPRVRC